jgi:hypothetical protein
MLTQYVQTCALLDVNISYWEGIATAVVSRETSLKSLKNQYMNEKTKLTKMAKKAIQSLNIRMNTLDQRLQGLKVYTYMYIYIRFFYLYVFIYIHIYIYIFIYRYKYIYA